MTLILMIMYCAAGILPLIGLGRAAIHTRQALRAAADAEPELDASPRIAISGADGSHKVIRLGDVANASEAARVQASVDWTRLAWDLVLVGAGIVIGTVASVIDVLLPPA